MLLINHNRSLEILEKQHVLLYVKNLQNYEHSLLINQRKYPVTETIILLCNTTLKTAVSSSVLWISVTFFYYFVLVIVIIIAFQNQIIPH